MVDDILIRALKEDIGTGDITADSIIPKEALTKGYIQAKEEGVLAGIHIAERVFILVNPEVKFKAKKNDGEKIHKGEVLAEVSGSARAILAGERLALNLLQRMSGIATLTHRVTSKILNTKTRVVDTRKTTPGLRLFEKYAVRIGGGHNHRFGLYDGILIKDNHIKVAGGIKEAVSLAKKKAPHTVKVEVEVESLLGVKEALEAGADIIMLDNMNIDMVKQAMAMIKGQALVEVSGGITEGMVGELAKLGVDFISMGALTHSVKALDISLDIGEIKPII